MSPRELSPEQLLDAFVRLLYRQRTNRGLRLECDRLRAEIIRRLRLVAVPDTPETVAQKCQSARAIIARLRNGADVD